VPSPEETEKLTDAILAFMEHKVECEASIQKNMNCPKCGYGITAVCAQFDKSGESADLDVLVEIYCKSADCGWEEAQWRPWKEDEPKVL
jgi:hypothetical protein